MSTSGGYKPVSFSFHKKGIETPQIPGTRISYHNAQLLTSTGVSSLDFHLGGGLPVGSVLLIEEDKFNTYSSVLLRYFISEGVVNNHTVLLAGGDPDPNKILNELPAVATVESKVQASDGDDQLKIAWRYKGQKMIPETFPSFCHTYDLSKIISSEQLNDTNLTTWNVLDHLNEPAENSCVLQPYLSLLSQIKDIINEQLFPTSRKVGHSLFRIAISSLGSPLWNKMHSNESLDFGVTILRFLYLLRSLLRSSCSVALITIPSYLLEDLKLRSKIHQMSDFVVKLESFIKIEKSQSIMFKDFHGLFYVVKRPCLNTFQYHIPMPDLAFKLKRKQFLIERLHLPPDIQESSESFAACGDLSKSLDF